MGGPIGPSSHSLTLSEIVLSESIERQDFVRHFLRCLEKRSSQEMETSVARDPGRFLMDLREAEDLGMYAKSGKFVAVKNGKILSMRHRSPALGVVSMKGLPQVIVLFWNRSLSALDLSIRYVKWPRDGIHYHAYQNQTLFSIRVDLTIVEDDPFLSRGLARNPEYSLSRATFASNLGAHSSSASTRHAPAPIVEEDPQSRSDTCDDG